MKTGVVLLNFGEPAEPDASSVAEYLERIFTANASLEDHPSEEALRERSRRLAERRAPGLLEEYREIGGSPLNEQARAQAAALEEELSRRGLASRVYLAMQFTEPFPRDAVRRAREAGVERLVALPVYPLCGRSTTVAALEDLAAAVDSDGREVERHEISGWHRHPGYLEIRADAVRSAATEAGVRLDDPGTRLVFSAHGTPLRYVENGNRYVAYVEEHCRAVADALGVEAYELGYQNHGNRPGVAWTEPDVEDVVEDVDAERIVVDAPSFMHEQSETLSELDRDLRADAEARGLGFVRVPVPHDDPRFAGVLADLVEGELPERSVDLPPLGPCRCRSTDVTRCLNAGPA